MDREISFKLSKYYVRALSHLHVVHLDYEVAYVKTSNLLESRVGLRKVHEDHFLPYLNATVIIFKHI